MDTATAFELTETRRLAALDALGLLDTAPEEDFDALVRLAATVTGCATAFIALIDSRRMWVKASVGTIPKIVPRAQSLCDTIIRGDAPLIVDDLAADRRFYDHWTVAAGSRFYAGMPIRTTDRDGVRQAVGTLCVLDTSPRTLDPDQIDALAKLALLAEALVVSRSAAREAVARAVTLERQQRLFRQAERMAKIGWWRLTLNDDGLEWSDGIFRIHELEPSSVPKLSEGLNHYPPAARAVVSGALADAIATGEPFDIEVDFITAEGQERRVRSMGEMECDSSGRPVAIIGVFRDMTEEHALSRALQRSAESDPLTHISNRAAFARHLESAMATAHDEGSPLALLLIDLDGFKRINDTFGHPAGDEVLKTVARRLHAPWLGGACAARLGGDEFAVIVQNAALLRDEDGLVARLTSELRVSSSVAGITLESGASVGLTRFDPARFPSQREFVHAADARLYAAKRARVGDRRAA